jgi:hypothetical protein
MTVLLLKQITVYTIGSYTVKPFRKSNNTSLIPKQHRNMLEGIATFELDNHLPTSPEPGLPSELQFQNGIN